MPNTGGFNPLSDSNTELQVEVSNLGGIGDCSVEIPKGVTVLAGENATNRTSLLRSIAAALGAEETAAVLKTDETEGYVRLAFDGRTYTREYEQTDTHTSISGAPVTSDPTLVDTFVAMLADNPARQAVELQGDLREVLMRPVDTDELQRRIERLHEERDGINEEKQQIEQERATLPNLREKKKELQDKIQEQEVEIEELEQSVSDHDIREAGAERAEELLDELRNGQQQLADTEEKITHHREKLTGLQERYAEVEDEMEGLTVPTDKLERLSSQIDELKSRKRKLETTINDLEGILDFNAELLRDDTTFLDEVTEDGVASQLNPDSQVVRCWTCGSSIQREAIDKRIETLRDVVAEKRAERDDITAEIEEVTAERKTLEQKKIERKEMENRRRELEREIKYRNEQISQLTEKAEARREDIEALQREVEKTEEIRENNLVDAYQRLSELQYERGRLEEELDAVKSQIDDIERREEKMDELSSRETEIDAELEELRGRIESLERSAVDAFNDRMEDLIDIFGYENITRIWIERVVSASAAEADIELHVVREDDGGVYEDTVETLSESERKLIGLVVGLAGYLVHDVYETVPLMLLDSLEAIDAERIAALLEYFSEFAPFLVVALLPEDAAAVGDECTVIQADAF